MNNPHNRPKHLQSKSWFRIDVQGETKLVRPVNGADWFDGEPISSGVVYLIDENSEIVTIMEIGAFNKHAKRDSSTLD